MDKPLAIRLQPKSLKDIVGQTHLIGKDKILTNAVKNNYLFSMILYGPPGVGKTSISMGLINDLDMHYRLLNATSSNKKDLEVAIEESKLYDGLVLVIDEIHRLNKDKQDILLPEIEKGNIILIGITTENPYHSINPAIRSRCELLEIKELCPTDIKKALKRALKSDLIPNNKFSNEAIDTIVKISGNDLRSAYNLLDIAANTTNKEIDKDYILSISNKPVFFSDKNGDGHYDVLSGLQKSIRGSDVDAALHYAARLIVEGDLDSLFRRLSVIAYEDIGLANPNIGPRLDAAINASLRVGLPEASIPIGEIIVEMALSPKSNRSHDAILEAIDDIKKGNVGRVPSHIRTSSTTYKYPFNYPGNYVIQQYLPNNLKDKKYYHPQDIAYEKYIKEVYDKIEKIKNNS